MPEQSITLLVLCGGQGRRMGGADKPLITVAGKAMVDHVLGSVPGGFERLISANRNVAEYARREKVVQDCDSGLADAHGPLAGIYAGLQHCRTRWMLSSPGDTPFLPEGWWRRLVDTAAGEHPAVVWDGERQQHLHLLLPVEPARRSLSAYLAQGRFEAHRWLEALKPRQAMFDDPGGFRNLNRPEDLPEL